MAVAIPIQKGDEVILRGLPDRPEAIVTKNSADQFCCITTEGITYNCSRVVANPIKTGRKYEVKITPTRSTLRKEGK